MVRVEDKFRRILAAVDSIVNGKVLELSHKTLYHRWSNVVWYHSPSH